MSRNTDVLREELATLLRQGIRMHPLRDQIILDLWFTRTKGFEHKLTPYKRINEICQILGIQRKISLNPFSPDYEGLEMPESIGKLEGYNKWLDEQPNDLIIQAFSEPSELDIPPDVLAGAMLHNSADDAYICGNMYAKEQRQAQETFWAQFEPTQSLGLLGALLQK